MNKRTDPDEPFGFFNGIDFSGIAQFLLATPVQFWGGLTFYKSAFHEVKSGNLGMAVLVVVGTTTAYISSVTMLVARTLSGKSSSMSLHFVGSLSAKSSVHWYQRPSTNQSLSFGRKDTSSMLITFVLMGKWLESRAKRSTSSALAKILALQPRTATRVVVSENIMMTYGDGVNRNSGNSAGKRATDVGGEMSTGTNYIVLYEEEIATTALSVGDIVRVLPGQKIPADGVVVQGRSTVDEAMISGEPMPVVKKKGSHVTGTCMNNVRISRT